uniref:Uncharacterized protein n=2 Tax=Cercopithecinae TaxID=9528 RepID=A0A2K5MDL5_CERAT
MRRQEVIREAYRRTQAARSETKCKHLGTPVVVEGMQRANTNDKMQFTFFSDITTVIHRAMDQMQYESITSFF